MESSWADFAAAAPELAAAGEGRLYKFGPGLAYLATVRSDGGPRVHPVCPTVVDGTLWVSLGPSPKQRDLRRDPRYALHTFPDPDVDDEFFVRGTATEVTDRARHERVRADLQTRGVNTTEDEALFELGIDRAMHAKYGPRPSWPPDYTTWRAPD